ncbi:MAG: 4'-phosphopantetheinyl transferase family protein [Pirellulaceae bacterium]
MTTSLGQEQVHVGYCLTDDPPWADVQPHYLSLLSTDECERYHRFMFDKDRRQFLLARALVRTMLSRYAPVAPRDWAFQYSAKGKPSVASQLGLSHLQFSHSHAQEVVACAITHSYPVGVDVESAGRDVNLKIARHCLAPAELQLFTGTDRTAQQTLLMRHWTLKEAYSKARGLGLSLGFTEYSFSFDDSGRPLLACHGASHDDPQQWQFYQTLIDGKYYLAVAVQCAAQRPCQFIVRRVLPELPPAAGPDRP